MSQRKRRKLGFTAKNKRKKKRARLKAVGKDPDKYYISGVFVGE